MLGVIQTISVINCSKYPHFQLLPHSLLDISPKAVVNMDSMFNGCPLLSLDLSDWDVSANTSRSGFNFNSPGVIMPKVWIS